MKKIVLGAVGALAIAVLMPMTANATTAVPSISSPVKIAGPNPQFDSVYATYASGGKTYAYMSNTSAIRYLVKSNGHLWKAHTFLTVGGKGATDQCGVHPVGGIVKVTPRYWYSYYHAESVVKKWDTKCNWSGNHTRWTIRRYYTSDAGNTWHKGSAVISQDPTLLNDPRTDDTGSPRLVVASKYIYLYYKAANRDGTGWHLNIARATRKSQGKPGSWYKYFKGAWNQQGLGGQQSALPGIDPQARSIAWNTYLKEFLAVKVDTTGLHLYTSKDRIHWKVYYATKAWSLSGSAWGQKCSSALPVAYGYGSLVGKNQSILTTGQSFWVYYVKKPAGKCFDSRYLYRRSVTLHHK